MFNQLAFGYSETEFAGCGDVMWLAVKKILRCILVKRCAIARETLGIAGPHAGRAFFTSLSFNLFEFNRIYRDWIGADHDLR